MSLPLCFIASFGLLVCGVPFSDRITFQVWPSSWDLMASSRKFPQLSSLAFVVSSLASLQASNHSFRWVFTFLRNAFHFLMAARTGGVIQVEEFFPGLDLPTCFSAAVLRIFLNWATSSFIESSLDSSMFLIASSTAVLKDSQSALRVFHLILL